MASKSSPLKIDARFPWSSASHFDWAAVQVSGDGYSVKQRPLLAMDP